MIFKLLAAFLVIEACVQYAAMEIIYAQKEWPEPLGTCVSADCHASKRENIDMECDRSYTVNGKPTGDTLYLKKLQGVALEKYQLTDENGNSTERTLKIDRYMDITKLSCSEANGKIHQICCGTKKIKTNAAEQEQLQQFCDEEGMKVVDNTNC